MFISNWSNSTLFGQDRKIKPTESSKALYQNQSSIPWLSIDIRCTLWLSLVAGTRFEFETLRGCSPPGDPVSAAAAAAVEVDEDGDLVLPRKQHRRDVIVIGGEWIDTCDTFYIIFLSIGVLPVFNNDV